MNIETLLFNHWGSVLEALPDRNELQELARNHGAIRRYRYNPDAQLWLRLCIMYAVSGFSLRETAAWSESQGLARISAVGLMKGLRRSGGFLKSILNKLLQFDDLSEKSILSRPIQIIDSSVIATQGNGQNWRIHTCFNLDEMKLVNVDLTLTETGESVERTPIKTGSIILADAGYCRYKQVQLMKSMNSDCIMRLHWKLTRIVDENGNKLKPWMLSPDEIGSNPYTVRGYITNKNEDSLIPVRIIMRLREEDDINKTLKRQNMNIKKNGTKKINPESQCAARWMMIITTLSEDEASAEQILELYRYRWQIELLFKRWKSIIKIDDLASKTPELVEVVLLARLIMIVLIDKIIRRRPDFSPRGRKFSTNLDSNSTNI
jgi:hypothetical protein